MSDAVSASTGSVRVCGNAPGGRSSAADAVRAVTGSRRNGRPFVSLRNLDIRRVRRTGSRRRVGGIVLIDAAGEPGLSRVAVTAGKEVGGAVERNRAKRRLREAVALAPIRSGRDYVLIATPGVVEAPFEELTTWVRLAVDVEDVR